MNSNHHPHTTQRTRRHERRGAILSAELVFVLPVVLTVLMAMIQFSMLWSTQQLAHGAAAAGCRTATYPGATKQDVEWAVARALHKPALAQNCLVQVQGGLHVGDEVLVTVQLPQSVAAPDLLRFVGYSLQGRVLTAQCLMRKE